jgi:hypothetical protein
MATHTLQNTGEINENEQKRAMRTSLSGLKAEVSLAELG